ncbi:sulfatase-like hydrolase/transferase, partial [bacterium]|nr:sulfatase-like hydrolase/transferase [bacterium]
MKTAFLLLLFGFLFAFNAFAEKPNILFIVSEDNSEQIGCYGDTRVHTPFLDSLAAGGVRYDRAYVPYSVCSP